MAKTAQNPEESAPASALDDIREGETLEEWVIRKNAEEGLGPDGHLLNESRHGDKWDALASYDPHLGNN